MPPACGGVCRENSRVAAKCLWLARTPILFSSELSEMLSISLNSEEVKSRAFLVYKHFVPAALFPTDSSAGLGQTRSVWICSAVTFSLCKTTNHRLKSMATFATVLVHPLHPLATFSFHISIKVTSICRGMTTDSNNSRRLQAWE